jgi:hypothetical protein
MKARHAVPSPFLSGCKTRFFEAGMLTLNGFARIFEEDDCSGRMLPSNSMSLQQLQDMHTVSTEAFPCLED